MSETYHIELWKERTNEVNFQAMVQDNILLQDLLSKNLTISCKIYFLNKKRELKRGIFTLNLFEG